MRLSGIAYGPSPDALERAAEAEVPFRARREGLREAGVELGAVLEQGQIVGDVVARE